MSDVAVHPLWGSLALERSGPISLQDQIVSYFREAISSGRIAPGRRIPSSRQLANEHGISRMTALEAYDRLAAEGYLFTKDRSGVFACTTMPDSYFMRAADRVSNLIAANGDLPLNVMPFDPSWHRLPLTPGLPAIDQFPWKEWSRLTAEVLRERPIDALHYGDPRGEYVLRTAVADYLGAARGISCTPNQIIIVGSSRHGVDMVARVLGAPGDKVWFEEPGHVVCRRLLEATGLMPVPIAVDQNGFDIAEAKKRAPHARLALVSPSHQYPLGVTMSVERRMELLEWADCSEGWIIEDDHDGEYRYSGRPIAPLYAMSQSERVIYIGSVSNLLAPGLRMGYIVVPKGLTPAFLVMSASLISIMGQLILARFIADGRLSSHLHRMRAVHSRRRALLIEAIKQHATDVLEVGDAPEAGMRIVATLAQERDDVTLARRAIEIGVHVHPLSPCYAGAPAKHGLILGFASTLEQEIEPSVRKLADLLRSTA
jgi:GntR family transcriptional regulator/MocR family aminotransferase